MSVPESEAPPPPPPIYTETMARLCWAQGDLPLAIEIYEKLKARHPEKAAYYEAQIMRIQRGEQP
jgi:outer membrane protein assembly factor BamD (BamD/ComL family)